MTDDPARAAFAYVGAFIDELARAGVRNVCIAPGSRSTPLALTVANNPDLRTWMHVDERSCAFFALGMARGLSEPVALICTSGTAAANFFPAIVEAKRAGVPLLVLTADRPPEMRDVEAPQTIDQNRLYGAHVKWFVDVAIPEATAGMLRYIRTLASRATSLALAAPAGPVHLNFPFREPLVPLPLEMPAELDAGDQLAWRGREGKEPWARVAEPVQSLSDGEARRVATILRDSEKPLIVCGPQYDDSLAAALAAVAARLDAPLLADPLSQVRWGAHDRSRVIDRYDAFLRHSQVEDELGPDLVLRIGGVPTSKALLLHLQRYAPVPAIVVDAARWPDPTHLAAEVIHADPKRFCEQILQNLEAGDSPRRDGWFAMWRQANATAAAAIEGYTCSLAEPFEGRAVADIVATLPDHSTLFVSSSMPVRDLDAFGGGDGKSIRVLANRGANGIDGVVSTALGVAAASRLRGGGPLVLVIGDLALYHDMNGLLAAKLHSLDATIVVLNNDGGGIFSFLPQAEKAPHFEKLFGTPHGLDFSAAAELYGATYRLVDDSASLRRAVSDGIAGTGLHLVELRTERGRNVELHREAWAAVGAGLSTIRE